ncbi:MAG: hypothetical protein U5K69_21370 [Balneolaceae bacterium]|nr:hypothetical protein [Balneolaceae bacterium]
MDDTWFYLPESKHDQLVTVQRKDDEGNWEPYPSLFTILSIPGRER